MALNKTIKPAPAPVPVNYREGEFGNISMDVASGHLDGTRDEGDLYNGFDANFNGLYTTADGHNVDVHVHSNVYSTAIPLSSNRLTTGADVAFTLASDEFVATGSGKVDLLVGEASASIALDTEDLDALVTFAGNLFTQSGAGLIQFDYQDTAYAIGYSVDKTGDTIETVFDANPDVSGDELTITYNATSGAVSVTSSGVQLSTGADGTISLVLDPDSTVAGDEATVSYNAQTETVTFVLPSGDSYAIDLGAMPDPRQMTDQLVDIVGLHAPAA